MTLTLFMTEKEKNKIELDPFLEKECLWKNGSKFSHTV